MVTTGDEVSDPMLEAMNMSSSSGNLKHKLFLLDVYSGCVLFKLEVLL